MICSTQIAHIGAEISQRQRVINLHITFVKRMYAQQDDDVGPKQSLVRYRAITAALPIIGGRRSSTRWAMPTQ